MTKKFLTILFVLTLILGTLSLNLSQSKAANDGGQESAKTPTSPLDILKGAYPGIGPRGLEGGATGVTISLYVARIINAALGFVSIILVIVILYAGFLWMTAGGNEEQITKAKKWLKNGVIGLVIIVMAWSISYFVIQKLLEISVAPPGQ